MRAENETKKVPVITKKRWRRAALCAAFCFACVQYCGMSVMAATADYSAITAPFDTLKGLLASILSAIGYIITLWGIGEWGLSYQGSEGTMQAQAFKRIGGGLVIILAPQILAILI